MYLDLLIPNGSFDRMQFLSPTDIHSHRHNTDRSIAECKDMVEHQRVFECIRQ